MRWLALVLLAAGCGRCSSDTRRPVPSSSWLEGRVEAETATPRRGGALVMRVHVEPAGFTRFDDRYAEGTMARYLTGTVYETLGRVDRARPEGPLTPWLASAWRLEGSALTVSLREGVRFHDGSPFSSADVRAVLLSVLDERNPTSAARAALGPIEAIEAPDARTVVIRWKAPAPFAMRSLLGAIPMMPASALQGAYESAAIHQAPIGTGPFTFASWERGAQLRLERFASHRQGAFLDAIVVRFVRDETLASQRWEQGEFDLMTRISPQRWRAMEQEPWVITGYQRLRVDEYAYGWFGWNLKHPVLADPRVRRALAHLYPAEVISRTVELGLERRTTCPFLPGSSSCDAAIGPLPFDPARAEELLEQAGWRDSDGDGVRDREGAPLAFSFLSISTAPRLTQTLTLYQEELARHGVRMTLEPVDAAQTIARMRRHEFDAAPMIWSSPDVVSDQFELFHSSQQAGGKNYVGLESPEIDRLLEEIRATVDDEARHALERQLHRLIFDAQPYLFLTLRPALDAAKRRVHGLEPSVAWYDLSRVWVE